MKTTVDISDTLLAEAKKLAIREGASVSSLVEEGLRQILKNRKRSGKRFKLDLITVKGRGIQNELGWELPRFLAYDLPSDER